MNVVAPLSSPPAVVSPSIARIKLAVCRRFGMDRRVLESHQRNRAIARPRQIAMFLATELTTLSLPAISRHFGWRDHTTVLYARDTITRLMAGDPELAGIVASLRRELAMGFETVEAAEEVVRASMAELTEQLVQAVRRKPLHALERIVRALNSTKGDQS